MTVMDVLSINRGFLLEMPHHLVENNSRLFESDNQRVGFFQMKLLLNFKVSIALTIVL
jgi:hypothetical protein